MIWCVEDDPSIRELETYVLNTTGLEACGFEDGQIFWETLQEKQPDLVILDMMLPGIDGAELLTRMKASEKIRDIPVIMATANTDSHIKNFNSVELKYLIENQYNHRFLKDPLLIKNSRGSLRHIKQNGSP